VSRALGKTAQKLVARARLSAHGSVSVSTGSGRGPKGGQHHWGGREHAAAQRLVKDGIFEFVTLYRSTDHRVQSEVSMTDFVYRLVDKG